MTTPVTAAVIPIQKFAWAKKIVLLVDVNAQTRDSRSRRLRSLGVTVHCAADVRAARSRYQSGSYNLVLVDLGSDIAAAEQLVQEIKRVKPRQLVAFLVGRPLYLVSSLNAAGAKPRGAPVKLDDRVRTLSPQALDPIDFGRKVRDAETAQRKIA